MALDPRCDMCGSKTLAASFSDGQRVWSVPLEGVGTLEIHVAITNGKKTTELCSTCRQRIGGDIRSGLAVRKRRPVAFAEV